MFGFFHKMDDCPSIHKLSSYWGTTMTMDTFGLTIPWPGSVPILVLGGCFPGDTQ